MTQDWLEEMITNNLWGKCCQNCGGGGGDPKQIGSAFSECPDCKGTGIVDWQIEPLQEKINQTISEAVAAKEKEFLEIIKWATSEDTGTSSQALCRWMLGLNASTSWGFPAPSDASDRGRCIRLLNLVPEWWDRLDEMADIPSHRINYFSSGKFESREEGWREQIPLIKNEAKLKEKSI